MDSNATRVYPSNVTTRRIRVGMAGVGPRSNVFRLQQTPSACMLILPRCVLLEAGVRCLPLPADQDIYPVQDEFELGVGQPAHGFGELRTVDREYLRDVSD